MTNHKKKHWLHSRKRKKICIRWINSSLRYCTRWFSKIFLQEKRQLPFLLSHCSSQNIQFVNFSFKYSQITLDNPWWCRLNRNRGRAHCTEWTVIAKYAAIERVVNIMACHHATAAVDFSSEAFDGESQKTFSYLNSHDNFKDLHDDIRDRLVGCLKHICQWYVPFDLIQFQQKSGVHM